MTNKLEISRELAERILKGFEEGLHESAPTVKELRALLADPFESTICGACISGTTDPEHFDAAGKCRYLSHHQEPPLIQTLHANGDRIAMEATIAQQAQRIADLERKPSDWEKGLEDADGNELITVRADEYAKLKADLERGRGEPVTSVMGTVVGGDFSHNTVTIQVCGDVPSKLWTMSEPVTLTHDHQAEQPAPVAVDNLRNFANAMIDIALEGCDADGAQIQELAVEHGLLKPESRTERCSDTCSCAEYADFPVECFRKVDELNQSRAS